MTEKNKIYQNYIKILKEELVPAMGCTEPIAIAYCAARAWDTARENRKKDSTKLAGMKILASGNIIKNVKSVIVPNTNGQKGIAAAAAAGVVSGEPRLQLEVLSKLKEEQKQKIKELVDQNCIQVLPAENDSIFYIEAVLECTDGTTSRVIIKDYHTNIVLVERNGSILFQNGAQERAQAGLSDRSLLNVKDIVAFADHVKLEDVADILKRQISCNMEIAQKGMEENWGANIGKTIRRAYGEDVRILAKAYAAAGSDARMSGCEKPVIIVSGSGNQGMTASIPVIVYARAMEMAEERLLRALVVSNLVTIHQKTGIGRLSAFCGAVSAGCGAGAGIAYLKGGDYPVVAHTIVNALAILSGMVCDGAKASCAAKIASAVDAGILGFEMFQQGQEFKSGDGIITKGVDNTISNVGRMAKDGMRQTDQEIIKIMCDM